MFTAFIFLIILCFCFLFTARALQSEQPEGPLPSAGPREGGARHRRGGAGPHHRRKGQETTQPLGRRGERSVSVEHTSKLHIAMYAFI